MADKNRRFSIKVKKKEWKKRDFRERERKGGGRRASTGGSFLGRGFFSFSVAREAIAPSFLFLVSQLLSFFLSLPVSPQRKKIAKNNNNGNAKTALLLRRCAAAALSPPRP
jgi:hypothetical protein